MFEFRGAMFEFGTPSFKFRTAITECRAAMFEQNCLWSSIHSLNSGEKQGKIWAGVCLSDRPLAQILQVTEEGAIAP